MDYIKVINELNEELYEKHGDGLGVTFNYITDGYTDLIYFDKIHIWDSEDGDGRKEGESFAQFIKRIFNKEMDHLHSLKL